MEIDWNKDWFIKISDFKKFCVIINKLCVRRYFGNVILREYSGSFLCECYLYCFLLYGFVL